MHRPEYIQLIKEAASILGIEVEYFTSNWAIQLRKGQITKFIVGYTLPLNDSTCYKIARNKNLCSEILSANKIANVPHQLILSPTILEKRNALINHLSARLLLFQIDFFICSSPQTRASQTQSSLRLSTNL